MLRERVIVTLLGVPVILVVIYQGGWLYDLVATLIVLVAASEYVRLFHTGGYKPAGFLVLAGVAGLSLARALSGFADVIWIVTGMTGLSMVAHARDYELGREQAGLDFAITLAGLLYFGSFGPYFISVRNLPDGLWWLLLALPVCWMADVGAYVIGSLWGKHKLSRRLSPRKTWEGYLGGILFAIPGGYLLALGLAALAPETLAMQPWQGAVMGAVLSLLIPLGDLGKSMVKRMVGAKDSGRLLPGHGGAWDRIDTWLWAMPLAYYLITAWFLV